MTDREQFQHGQDAARADLARLPDLAILRAYDRCRALPTHPYAMGYCVVVDDDGRLRRAFGRKPRMVNGRRVRPALPLPKI